jgi:hypothetical protein
MKFSIAIKMTVNTLLDERNTSQFNSSLLA